MKNKINISVCLGSSCSGRSNREVLTHLRDYVKNNELSNIVNIDIDYCFGKCSEGPAIMINEIIYTKITPKKAIILLEGYLGVENH